MTIEEKILGSLKRDEPITIRNLNNFAGQGAGGFNVFFALLVKMQGNGKIFFPSVSIENSMDTTVAAVR